MNSIIRKIQFFFRVHFFIYKPEDYLIKKIKPEKIEEELQIEYQDFFKKPYSEKCMDKTFLENSWLPFISKLKKGDELWFYRLPPECWEKNMGHQGYIIIRNGKKVADLISVRN